MKNTTILGSGKEQWRCAGLEGPDIRGKSNLKLVLLQGQDVERWAIRGGEFPELTGNYSGQSRVLREFNAIVRKGVAQGIGNVAGVQVFYA